MNKQQAQEIFMQRVIQRAIVGSSESIQEELIQESKADVFQSLDFKKAKTWFNELSDEEKKMATTLIEKSILASAFGTMVVIDDVMASRALNDQFSDFALYLQIYNDTEGKRSNQYIKQIRINDSDTEYLHDILPTTIDY